MPGETSHPPEHTPQAGNNPEDLANRHILIDAPVPQAIEAVPADVKFDKGFKSEQRQLDSVYGELEFYASKSPEKIRKIDDIIMGELKRTYRDRDGTDPDLGRKYPLTRFGGMPVSPYGEAAKQDASGRVVVPRDALDEFVSSLHDLGNGKETQAKLEELLKKEVLAERTKHEVDFHDTRLEANLKEAQRSVGPSLESKRGPFKASRVGVISTFERRQKNRHTKETFENLHEFSENTQAAASAQLDKDIEKGKVNIYEYDRSADGVPKPTRANLVREVLHRLSPQESLRDFANISGTVNQSLNKWKLGEASPETEELVSSALLAQEQFINSLPEHDPSRPKALEMFVRTKFRLEERRILAGEQKDYWSEFTPEGGIIVNDGEAVIYDNGDIERIEQGQKILDPKSKKMVQQPSEPVRRSTNGEISTERPQVLHESKDANLEGRSMAELLTSQQHLIEGWDKGRSNALASSLWKTSREIAHRYSGETAKITKERDAHQELFDSMHEQYVDTDQPPNIIKKMHDLRADISRFNARLTAIQGLSSKANFWQARMEVGRKVEGSKRSAKMDVHGAVRWENARLNDKSGDWYIKQDGESILDLGDGKIEHYTVRGKMTEYTTDELGALIPKKPDTHAAKAELRHREAEEIQKRIDARAKDEKKQAEDRELASINIAGKQEAARYVQKMKIEEARDKFLREEYGIEPRGRKGGDRPSSSGAPERGSRNQSDELDLSDIDPEWHAYFDPGMVAEWDEYIAQAIRDEVHLEKDAANARGANIDKLPDDQFKDITRRVKSMLIDRYFVGTDATDEIKDRFDQALFLHAKQQGRIVKKPRG